MKSPSQIVKSAHRYARRAGSNLSLKAYTDEILRYSRNTTFEVYQAAVKWLEGKGL